jgi:hypothetical protein
LGWARGILIPHAALSPITTLCQLGPNTDNRYIPVCVSGSWHIGVYLSMDLHFCFKNSEADKILNNEILIDTKIRTSTSRAMPPHLPEPFTRDVLEQCALYASATWPGECMLMVAVSEHAARSVGLTVPGRSSHLTRISCVANPNHDVYPFTDQSSIDQLYP